MVSSETQPPTTWSVRQERIVAAAVREFGAKGYAAASTNAVAAAAGVAKGLLFHHFGSKEALFAAAYERAAARTAEAMYQDLESLPTDLFERFAALGVRKLQLVAKDPDAYRLVSAGLAEAPAAVRAALMKKQSARTSRDWPGVVAGVDASRLRPGVSTADAIETIALLFEGYEHRVQQALGGKPDRGAAMVEQLTAGTRKLLDRLRDGLYAAR